MNDNQRLRIIQTDPRPTDELIQLALSQDEEEDTYWEALTVLHFRGTREVLDAACELCRSTVPKERFVGIDILMKLGESVRMLREAREYLATTPQSEDKYTGAREHHESIVEQLSDVIDDAKEYPQEAVSALLPMLDTVIDPCVLREIVLALGWYRDYHPCVVERLARMVHHSDSDVRHAVTMSLTMDHPLAIQTLITLSSDADSLVRDWATFGLGLIIDTDTPEIRDALAARLDDEDDDVFNEAVNGLALRGDSRVVPAVVSERELHESCNDLSISLINAGKLIGDPRLLPLLLEEKKEWNETNIDNEADAELYQDLLTAIARCTQGR